MKYLITVFLLLFAVSVRAQITLEHTYMNSTDFALIQVDSAEWKYINYNEKDSISIYNLDHSLDRIIIVPIKYGGNIALIAKRFFSLDGLYGYMVSADFNYRIYEENGQLLFSCDTCSLGSNPHESVVGIGLSDANGVGAFITTDSGTKMTIVKYAGGHPYREIYSLPGKLPTCSTTPLSAVNHSTAYANPSLPTFAYPNPSSSSVRIVYELPSGVSSGDLILTTEDGREVKRYRVTSAFSDLLIDAGGLESGSYFYKVVTNKGESRVQKISLVK